MKTTERIGGYVTTWRKVKGYKSKEVAEKLGVNCLTYSKLERGVNVGTDIFNKLESVYGVRLEDIIRDIFNYGKV